MKRILIPILALVALLGGCTAKALSVTQAWARPGVAGGNSAVYFVIDAGNQADTLLKASSDVAAAVELHQSQMGEDGTMKMAAQENVPIPANTRVTFEPGGLHVMLIGLKDDLNSGDAFQVTLTFEKAGDITLDVPVKEP